MHYFIQLLAAVAGSLGFSALFNIRGRKLIYSTFGGFLAWAVYLLALILPPKRLSVRLCFFRHADALRGMYGPDPQNTRDRFSCVCRYTIDPRRAPLSRHELPDASELDFFCRREHIYPALCRQHVRRYHGDYHCVSHSVAVSYSVRVQRLPSIPVQVPSPVEVNTPSAAFTQISFCVS